MAGGGSGPFVILKSGRDRRVISLSLKEGQGKGSFLAAATSEGGEEGIEEGGGERMRGREATLLLSISP